LISGLEPGRKENDMIKVSVSIYSYRDYDFAPIHNQDRSLLRNHKNMNEQLSEAVKHGTPFFRSN